jgi:hypothetical protein
VVKLDCDLQLPADYFEKLLERFHSDPQLGIASGIYLERRAGQWIPLELPDYHAAGAMKMLRRECYEAINGFVCSPGWDTVDEIRAQVKGWKTKHYSDLRVLHLKDEGSGAGFLKMSRMSGEIHYLTGGGVTFFVVKSIHRLLFGKPVIAGGMAMVAGYLKCVVTRRKRLVNVEEMKHYRTLLNRRMRSGLKDLRFPTFGGGGARYS